MVSKETSRLVGLPTTFVQMRRIHLSQWQIVGLASLSAAAGAALRSNLMPPLLTFGVTALTVFGGWYVWGLFTYLTETVLFGGQADYRRTLNAFGYAYAFQALSALVWVQPLNWLWGWVALYAIVIVWGIVGPRRTGARTWEAVVAASTGMLVWLACLWVLALNLTWNGMYTGVGVFLI